MDYGAFIVLVVPLFQLRGLGPLRKNSLIIEDCSKDVIKYLCLFFIVTMSCDPPAQDSLQL